ncbi:MAG: hypothetical protein H6Q26_1538 [Bacteroidetes bacterium]|nr:hypothetical protein [Bacteroidota bacterium]
MGKTKSSGWSAAFLLSVQQRHKAEQQEEKYRCQYEEAGGENETIMYGLLTLMGKFFISSANDCFPAEIASVYRIDKDGKPCGDSRQEAVRHLIKDHNKAGYHEW